MLDKNKSHRTKGLFPVFCILALVAIGVVAFFWFQSDKQIATTDTSQKENHTLPERPVETFRAVPREKVIDFNRVDEDEELQAIQQERKKEFGLDKGVDGIVTSDESFKVGDSIITMREILEKIRIKQGDVIEERLPDDAIGKIAGSAESDQIEHSFGIYVVKPNDNLWNIHFRFLKDYFDNKNIRISPMADRPDSRGFSSGVGKILKFSEKIVYIYNIRDRKLDVNLHLIHPDSEIVVFHISEILSLLGRIDLENVDMIRFDGENLWISAES